MRLCAILAAALSLPAAEPTAYPSDYAVRKVRLEPRSLEQRLALPRRDRLSHAELPLLGEAVRRQLLLDGYKDAAVEAQLVPVAPRQADLIFHARPGKRWVIGNVEFSGEDAAELRKALRALRPRVILPAVWKSRPPFSYDAIASDLERLRASYVSRGWLEARVLLDAVEFQEGRVAVKIQVQPGRRYPIGAVRLPGGRAVPAGDVCACLLAERNRALREGRLDFRAWVKAESAGDGGVDLKVFTEPGPAYRTGRIEFEGNHSVSDQALRKALLLEEGKTLDAERLARSLRRLDRLGFFEPISADSVQLERDPGRLVADLRIRLREQNKRRWSVSGPLGPPQLGGPFRAELAMRLPGWGRGILEASTYYLSLTLTALQPAVSLLPGSPPPLFPLFVLRRPFLPGQEWSSGLLLSPQLGWQRTAALYGIAQPAHRLQDLLESPPEQPPLVVPVHLASGAETALLCEPPTSPWSWLRTAARIGLGVATGGV
ncbi:MAG TPA: POTRA domain-containing protein [Bryobacteraceae bacterium]|nr:POTRA domain-containing protein [Bryobacteraceae bacterium]